MDSTSLIMGLVILLIIAIPVVLLARAGKSDKNKNE
jgi:hypothetical protein